MPHELSIRVSVSLSLLSLLFVLACGNSSEQEDDPNSQVQTSIPDGWKEFSTSNFKIWLPHIWDGGSEKEFDRVVELFQSKGRGDLTALQTPSSRPSVFAIDLSAC
jgi:hypothetical protein